MEALWRLGATATTLVLHGRVKPSCESVAVVDGSSRNWVAVEHQTFVEASVWLSLAGTMASTVRIDVTPRVHATLKLSRGDLPALAQKIALRAGDAPCGDDARGAADAIAALIAAAHDVLHIADATHDVLLAHDLCDLITDVSSSCWPFADSVGRCAIPRCADDCAQSLILLVTYLTGNGCTSGSIGGSHACRSAAVCNHRW